MGGVLGSELVVFTLRALSLPRKERRSDSPIDSRFLPRLMAFSFACCLPNWKRRQSTVDISVSRDHERLKPSSCSPPSGDL
jgi:hypothetical protein